MTQERTATVPVIDLFAGPGGLGEGFSALRVSDDRQPFKIQLSIEKDATAHETLRLRSFYRQFAPSAVPATYYDVLRGKLSIASLFEAYPAEAKAARRESWQATLGLTARRVLNGRIRNALNGSDRWVLIGGPPCQAYSVAGRSRNNGNRDCKADADHRQYLYVEYLQVIADHWPAVFVMENVKGLLSANVNNGQLFQTLLDDLRSPQDALRREDRNLEDGKRRHSYRVLPLTPRRLANGIEVGDYVVFAEKHGVPQARHRVILVGVRDDLGDVSLPELPQVDQVSIRRVLEGLPRLRSGLTKRDSVERWLGILASVPAVESFWLNKYADGIFRPLVAGHDRIQPLTILSIEELESLLPHMIRDGLTWPEILGRRFHNGTVLPISVHQAVYEWARERQLPPSRNDFLLKAYSDTFNESLALHRSRPLTQSGFSGLGLRVSEYACLDVRVPRAARGVGRNGSQIHRRGLPRPKVGRKDRLEQPQAILVVVACITGSVGLSL